MGWMDLWRVLAIMAIKSKPIIRLIQLILWCGIDDDDDEYDYNALSGSVKGTDYSGHPSRLFGHN